jgi:hypothetical protein
MHLFEDLCKLTNLPAEEYCVQENVSIEVILLIQPFMKSLEITNGLHIVGKQYITPLLAVRDSYPWCSACSGSTTSSAKRCTMCSG